MNLNQCGHMLIVLSKTPKPDCLIWIGSDPADIWSDRFKFMDPDTGPRFKTKSMFWPYVHGHVLRPWARPETWRTEQTYREPGPVTFHICCHYSVCQTTLSSFYVAPIWLQICGLWVSGFTHNGSLCQRRQGSTMFQENIVSCTIFAWQLAESKNHPRWGSFNIRDFYWRHKDKPVNVRQPSKVHLDNLLIDTGVGGAKLEKWDKLVFE